MKKIIKIYFKSTHCKSWCILFLFIIQYVYAFAQDESLTVQHSFETYNNSNYQEKVFLHTDKTVYATGEILWLKAYITNATNNMLSSLSSICYVEVISSDNRPLLQAKLDIDSGRGNGSFMIPSSIRSGNYLIRAYTNWMKNFEPSFYFEQPLTIININKKAQAADTSNTGKYSIQFLPEGGNIIYGLENTVAFKLTDAYGKGVQGKGAIVNEKNETVVSFEAEHFGMGTFNFTPVKGNKYHAIVQLNNKTLIQDLPEIYNTGWALHVKDEGNTLLVSIASNVEQERNVFLFAQTRHSIKFAKVQPLNNGSANFIINKTDLGEGVSQLTVFNEKKQAVCERLFFKRPANYLQIKLNNFQQNYQPRNKVKISVSTNDAIGQALDADMSLAVYLTDSLQPEQKINLINYLWLSSDLKGTVESPQYYFGNPGVEVDKAIDNLMLTNGWRRFKWEDVLNNNKPSFTFLPETEGHIITGKLSPKIAGLPVNGINVSLSVPGKDFKFSNSTASATGYVRFNVEKFYGNHEIIAQTDLGDSNYLISIDNPFVETYTNTGIQPFNLKSNFKDEILVRSIGAQAQNSYLSGKKENFVLPISYDTTGFFGKPSKSYDLDGYTRFPTMEEVMREFVKEVRVRKSQKGFHYEVFDEPAVNYLADDPLVLIDGVKVPDITKIIAVDPLKIKKIDVITNKFFQGQQEYFGIVSYSTYNNDLDGYQLDPNSLVIEYEGLQLEREFYSPQYETKEQTSSRIPDYRNVLYWSPDLKTVNGKQDISFYTSDIPGNYVVIIQGISDSGLVGFSATNFIIAPARK